MADKNTISWVTKRDGRLQAFDREKIAWSIFRAAQSVGGKDRELASELAIKVEDFMLDHFPEGAIPGVEDILDVTEKVLIEEGHARTAKAYILYRYEQDRKREAKEKDTAGVEGNIPYKVIWRVLAWYAEHDVETVDGINRHIRNGTLPGLIREEEVRYNESIRKAAAQVYESQDSVRLIVVAGPSSSGKSTATLKLTNSLRELGLDIVPLIVDNYFFDLEMHPKDEYGDYDFEVPQALDLELINEHLAELMAGHPVETPRYNFKTGLREKETDRLQLAPGQILMIDSLHGFYPPMTRSVPTEMKFRFYTETLCQIKDHTGKFVRWADVRMLRRMARDMKYRQYTPIRTVGHWHYVRRSEKSYILPFIQDVEYILNGALSYELPYMRTRLVDYFPEILKTYRDDPKRQDAFMRAERTHRLLSSFDPMEDETLIPGDSVLREFLGGSILKY
jgi:uridine kinase